MLLDKAAFQHQGLKLAVAEDILEPVHVGDHAAHLVVVVFLRAKVLADPVLQSLGLADVDDVPGPVVHDVHPGGKGQLHGLAAQLLFLLLLFHCLTAF